MKFILVKHIRKIAIFKKVCGIKEFEVLQLWYDVLTQVSSAFGFKETRLFFDVCNDCSICKYTASMLHYMSCIKCLILSSP